MEKLEHCFQVSQMRGGRPRKGLKVLHIILSRIIYLHIFGHVYSALSDCECQRVESLNHLPQVTNDFFNVKMIYFQNKFKIQLF
jgi:hypothetical protein